MWPRPSAGCAKPPGIERIAMIGFSAGGHLSYLAACRLPVSRTAVLYGGWLPSTDIPMSQPTPTLELTPGITGRLLYLVGEEDSLIGASQRGQIRDALRAAGTDHELVVYPGTEHAFFWPGTRPSTRRPGTTPGRGSWPCWPADAGGGGEWRDRGRLRGGGAPGEEVSRFSRRRWAG